MANLNLLPWREARRERLKQEFITNVVAAIVIACLVLAVAYTFVASRIDEQNSRNQYIKNKINQLEEDVAEIAKMKANRASLIDRMQVIQGLQGNRPVIVRVFDQFVETLPDGVFYTALKAEGENIEIQGTAESNNRVSSLMRRLDKSEWFVEPNLTSVVSNPAVGEQANNFVLTVGLSLPDASEDDQ